jgi:CDP-diglyceride synthetase
MNYGNLLIITALIGIPMVISRFIILKDLKRKRIAIIQTIVFTIYVLVIGLLQWIDFNNSNVYLTEVIIIIWLGFYVVVEPIITSLFSDANIDVRKRNIKTNWLSYVISTFGIMVMGVIVLFIWVIQTVGLWD